jgi:hypothetical protein
MGPSTNPTLARSASLEAAPRGAPVQHMQLTAWRLVVTVAAAIEHETHEARAEG